MARVRELQETAGTELSWFKPVKRFTPFKTFKSFNEDAVRDPRIDTGHRD